MSKKLPKYLKWSEVEELARYPDSERDRAILTTLAYEGLRVSELCNLAPDDIDHNGRWLKVVQGKGKKDRVIPLHPKVSDAIKWYVGEYFFDLWEGESVFPLSTGTVRYIVKKYAKLIGLPAWVHPHTLRHSIAIKMLEETRDLRAIQLFLGHASIQTTTIYLQMAPQDVKRRYLEAFPEA